MFYLFSNLKQQLLKKLYQLNGALYLAKIEWLRKRKHFIKKDTKAYIMPWERSVDIDEPIDFFYAEKLMEMVKEEIDINEYIIH